MAKTVIDSSGSLRSSLGNAAARRPKPARPMPGETRQQFRDRLDREAALLRAMDTDPSRDGTGRRRPVRYED